MFVSTLKIFTCKCLKLFKRTLSKRAVSDPVIVYSVNIILRNVFLVSNIVFKTNQFHNYVLIINHFVKKVTQVKEGSPSYNYY